MCIHGKEQVYSLVGDEYEDLEAAFGLEVQALN